MRLTPKKLHVDEIKNFVDKFNDKGDDPYFRSKVIDKLWEYENAEEQELIIKLPCKVGASVYAVNPFKKSIDKWVVIDIGKNKNGTRVWVDVGNGVITKYLQDINKSIFLTKAEALQALKERE